MNKNIVIIVADSLSYRADINDNFLPKLESLELMNLQKINYSQGPYTEAGIKSFLTGKNVLSGNGYFKFTDDSKNTIFDVLFNEGYKIISYHWMDGIYNIDQLNKMYLKKYTTPFSFKYLWESRIKYFSNLYKNGQIDSYDYKQLIGLFDEIFPAFENFYSNKDTSSFNLIRDRIDFSKLDSLNRLIKKEFSEYLSNKAKYIEVVLKGDKSFFINDDYFDDNICSKEYFEIVNKNKFLSIKLRLIQIKNVLFKFKIDIKGIYQNIKKRDYSSVKTHLYFIKYFLYESSKIFGNNNHTFLKNTPSCNKIFNDFIEDFEKLESPFCAYIHINDTHIKNNCYSYDSKSYSKLYEEFHYIEDNLHKLNGITKFCDASIALSKLYFDNEVNILLNKMKTKNKKKYENTLFVITGDRGHAYDIYKTKSNISIDFRLENYKTPLYMFSSNSCKKIQSQLISNVDLLPTIISCLGLKKTELTEFDGINLISKQRDYVFLEFHGSGCPDFRRKEVWISTVNDSYQVNYVGNVFDDFHLDKVFYFNLKEDPEQKCILKEFPDDDIFKDLLNRLHSRFVCLKKEKEQLCNYGKFEEE